VPAIPAATEPPTMRERYRAQVRQEVKQAALRQLAESGQAGVSISAIGKELGVSGPALYRYFAGRDDLLTELVIDAYDDLADALRAAAGPAPDPALSRKPNEVPRLEPRARLEAAARAYRTWALAEPHRYRLLFGPPLPGYDAHTQRLVDAAQAAMNVLLEALRKPADHPRDRPAAPAGDSPATPVTQPGPLLAAQLSAWAQSRHLDTDPATALRGVLLWSRLHGFVSLEIAGNFASMGLDPESLFEIQLAALADPG
jgi:AcrR family transcriptional regulator